MFDLDLQRLVGPWLIIGVLSASVTGQVPSEAEWIKLFDGSSLAAWRGYQSENVPPGWVIDDGVLKHESDNVDLLTRDTFQDFDLRFEWRIAANGNSGVVYRCDEQEPESYMTGPEYQLVDSEAWALDSRDPQASGALYGLFPATEDAVRPTGEWNSGRIVVHRGRIEHWLNGTRIVEAELESGEWRARIDGTKFANWERFGTLTTGHIALQAHLGRGRKMDPVWFRNIMIRRLDESGPDDTARQ